MIVWNGKKYPTAIHWLGKNIIAVYAASMEIWVLFLSCFGRGYWINELPWVDTDAWKNAPGFDK